MTKIDKLSVSWNGLLEEMAKVVACWCPPKLTGEIKYRDHLLRVLRERLPEDANVEKEFRNNGTTADLWVRWRGLVFNDEVLFELKLDLQRKPDYDRLVGQIEGLKPGSQKIIVVLIGESDPTLLGRLRQRYADYTEAHPMQSMLILSVPLARS